MKIKSMDDLEKLPEGKWVQVETPIKLVKENPKKKRKKRKK
jgi:hypothetical protein